MLSEKKKIFNIILEKLVKEEIDRMAIEDDRSSSAMINWILKKYIEQIKKDKKDN